MRIWAKIIVDDRVSKGFVLESTTPYDESKFREYVQAICDKLDIPTPIILNKHINHYNEFNHTAWRANEFVESVDFDKLEIEEATIKSAKKPQDDFGVGYMRR